MRPHRIQMPNHRRTESLGDYRWRHLCTMLITMGWLSISFSFRFPLLAATPIVLQCLFQFGSSISRLAVCSAVSILLLHNPINHTRSVSVHICSALSYVAVICRSSQLLDV